MLHIVRSDRLKDQLKRVQVRISWEQRHAIENFSEDASDGPHIYSAGVSCITDQKLRRPIPPGGDVVRVLVRS